MKVVRANWRNILVTAIISVVAVFTCISPVASHIVLADPPENSNQSSEQSNSSNNSSNSNSNSSNNSNESSSDANDDGDDSCQSTLHGFGWIFCPGQTVVGNLIDLIAGAIDKAMNWTLLATNSDKVVPIWQNFLNIANIIFTIIFIVMIMSMALSIGPMSNYDIKKILPHLLAVAVLVNLSFYVCAAMVDISNIAGKGVYNLLTGQLTTTGGGAGNVVSDNFNDLIADAFAMGTGVVLAFIMGGTIIISIVLILLAIAIRQIALIVLVIASPVIFALYVLPNTEKTAQKVMDMFIRLLIVYPLFMAVWGGSRLVSNIIASVGTDPILQLIATTACSVAPAVAIVPLFNMSGGLMKSAISAMNKPAASAGKMVNGMERRAVGTNAVRFMGKHADNKVIGAARRSPLVNKILADNDALDYEAKIDKSALDSATAWAKTLDSNQLASVVKNGYYNEIGRGGKTKRVNVGDNYRLRAAAATYGSDMGVADVHDALAYANKRANWLESKKRGKEAAQLRRAYADAAIASKKAAVADSALNAWGNSVPSSAGWHSDFEQKYNEAVASKASGMTFKELSQLKQPAIHHMEEALSSGENNAEMRNDNAAKAKFAKAQDNMREGAESILRGSGTLHGQKVNPTKQERKLYENVRRNPATIEALGELGKPLRTKEQQRTANYFNLDTTYSYFNMKDNPEATHYAVEHIRRDVINAPEYADLSDYDKDNIKKINNYKADDVKPSVAEWKLPH